MSLNETLRKTENLSITVKVSTVNFGEKAPEFLAEASAQKYDPEKTGDRGPLITKTVNITRLGKTFDEAQSDALAALVDLLGL